MLQQRGDIVVGQVRRISGICALRQLGAEPVVADLTRASALVDAMAGCDVVFHVAQFFDFWAPQQTIFHTINVFGAENAMAAALRAKVPRVVFCSSSLTIGEQPGYMGTEKTQHRGYTLTAFERSKLAAEQAALHYRAKGIEVVIVNPALVVAPSDPGWTGRLIADGVAGRRPIPEVLDDLLLVADDAVLVQESSIIAAMRMLHDHAGLVVEPSAALGIAAILEDPPRFSGRQVVTIVCGSNVDADAYRRWVG
jgi:nucleoside-diphosphate-sugar epimerase